MQPNLDGFPGRVNSVLEIELKQPNSFLASQWDQSSPCKVPPKLFLVPLIAFSSWKLQNKHTLFNSGYTALRTVYPTLKSSTAQLLYLSCADESRIRIFYYYHCFKIKLNFYDSYTWWTHISNPYQMLPSSGTLVKPSAKNRCLIKAQMCFKGENRVDVCLLNLNIYHPTMTSILYCHCFLKYFKHLPCWEFFTLTHKYSFTF